MNISVFHWFHHKDYKILISGSTVFSQSSSSSSTPFKTATTINSSAGSGSPLISSTKKSTRRISARDGSRILDKFERKNTITDDASPGKTFKINTTSMLITITSNFFCNFFHAIFLIIQHLLTFCTFSIWYHAFKKLVEILFKFTLFEIKKILNRNFLKYYISIIFMVMILTRDIFYRSIINYGYSFSAEPPASTSPKLQRQPTISFHVRQGSPDKNAQPAGIVYENECPDGHVNGAGTTYFFIPIWVCTSVISGGKVGDLPVCHF